MRILFSNSGGSGFWTGPAALGVMLVLIGVLLLIWPALLQILVATVFLVVGASLLGMAWSMRRRVTYRRMNGARGPFDNFPPD